MLTIIIIIGGCLLGLFAAKFIWFVLEVVWAILDGILGFLFDRD